jgi:hypothetical protein
MTTKTDITLPKGITNHGIVGHDGSVYTDVMVQDIIRAAVEADRRDKSAKKYQIGDETYQRVFKASGLTNLSDMQAVLDAVESALVEADRQGRMPSDGMDDVLNDALSNLEHDNYERSHQGYENRQADIELIRAALSRYGSGQPAASAEPSQITDAMVDAYFKAQADVIRKVDDMWGNGGKAASYLQPVRESCRAGLQAALGVAAPVAQEPAAEVLSNRKGNDTSTIDKALPAGTKLYVGPIAAQAQPVAFAKDGVLFWHGEHASWRGFNGDLYLAVQPQQSENPEALADTQRAIIEAAERRGYARAEAENVGYRTDAGRYRFIRPGDKDVWCSSGDDLLSGVQLDAAIDTARAAARARPTMPALTDAMRAVLRNEHDVYLTEDALYAALCDAAGAQPSGNSGELPTAQDREDAHDIEAAAKTLAECMDYPWEHMPEKGREEMRKHAKRVIDAARAAKERT